MEQLILKVLKKVISVVVDFRILVMDETQSSEGHNTRSQELNAYTLYKICWISEKAQFSAPMRILNFESKISNDTNNILLKGDSQIISYYNIVSWCDLKILSEN